jgi:NTE family protein
MPDSSEQITVSRDPDGNAKPRIGLCLSGGGFRAALFGLGVLRYLAEAGRLQDVVAVSAVSGGSITAALLADRWPDLERDLFSARAFESHAVGPFLATVTKQNLRNRGMAAWMVTRVAPRRRPVGAAVGAAIAKHMLRTRCVADLPAGLQVILTATDLVSGRAFRVSRDFIGGWEFGYGTTPPTLTLGTAIAASTAVPFLFPPVHLRTEGLGLRPTVPARLALVDGGVYDNLGLEWFQGWDRGRPHAARPANFIVVIDASAPLLPRPKRYGWLTSLRRSQEVQYAQTRASRVRWFVDHLLMGRLQGVHIPIDRDPRGFDPPPGVEKLGDAADGALPDGFARAISSLRTDLDRFQPEECQLLLYHGYWSAHVRLRHLQPVLAIEHPAWREYADVDAAEGEQLLSLLAEGQRRTFWRS